MAGLCARVIIMSLFLAGCGKVNALNPEQDHASDLKIINTSNQNLDLLAPGAYSSTRLFYATPASEDKLVVSGFLSDVRGALYLPDDARLMANSVPIVVYLHGNAATCRKSKPYTGVKPTDLVDPSYYAVDLTTTGKCPRGYEELNSYLGIDRIAQHLNSHGIAVIAVNANRGVNANGAKDRLGDPLIDGRGQLMLKHLAYFQNLNQDNVAAKAALGVELNGVLDFSNVMLMGHSRGGEGARAAAHFHQTADGYGKVLQGMTVKGVFEFAATDGYGSYPFAAKGVSWASVMASCDNDLLFLPNAQTYMRRIDNQESASTALVLVKGANHNYFNEQWDLPDGNSCGPMGKYIWGDLFMSDGSPEQYEIGQMFVSAFARGHLGTRANQDQYLKVFDPQWALPSQVVSYTEIARSRYDGASAQDYNMTSLKGHDLKAELVEERPLMTGLPIDILETFAPIREMVLISPDGKNPQYTNNSFLDINLQSPIPVSDDRLLLMESSSYLVCANKSCEDHGKQDFELALVLSDGSVSNYVEISDYLNASSEANWVYACPTIFESSNFNYCITYKVDQQTCLFNGLNFSSKTGGCYLDKKWSYFVFDSIPIELSDFGVSPGAEAVSLRVKTKAGSQQPLILGTNIYTRKTDLY